ncbi:cytochrome P450 [Microthyrium microscopicum]|uniref:Cytochrome P450 n=1 Tax=Microthyrium microscopicum TaxID=703497 RepID=A0A6A6U0S9_9PEZI|nr:cytochrome P450 [Microthyrium microscopicum]
MHEKYGPVVRINPSELHVNDPAFYHTLYTGPTRRTDKWHWSARMFGTSDAIVGTTDHALHHARKAALNPYFSKASVTKLEPLIQEKVELLCSRLKEHTSHEHEGKRHDGQVFNLSDVFTAFSADVIGSYVFGAEYAFLSQKDFAPELRRIMTELSRSTHLMKQVGWVFPLVMSRLGAIIRAIAACFSRPLKYLFWIRRTTQNAIIDAKTKASRHQASKGDVSGSVMQSLMTTNTALSDHELSINRLTDEGITLLGAGTVTTAQTLSNTVYFLLANPPYLSRLRTELTCFYNDNPTPTWSQLSQLPFLTAVIYEGLRLSYGVSSRLPRIAPDTELQLPTGQFIPKGTPVSMTHMFLHDDAELFSNPLAFLPERWLQEDGAENPTANRKFFVPFSRGTRSCLGTNLAWAELYMVLAGLFRRTHLGGVDVALFETVEDEVRVDRDYFNPAPRRGAVGVRVTVSRDV